jgi:hypothetical protein
MACVRILYTAAGMSSIEFWGFRTGLAHHHSIVSHIYVCRQTVHAIHLSRKDGAWDKPPF